MGFMGWGDDEANEERGPRTAAWGLSLLVHLGAVVAIAAVGVSAVERGERIEMRMPAEPVEEIAETPHEFYFSNTPEEQIGANSTGGGLDAAFASAAAVSDVSSLPSMGGGEVLANPAESVAMEHGFSQIKLREDVAVATGPHFSEHLNVRGAAGVGTTGAVGAIDRITHEILLSLEQRKTLVVWLFDQSGSLESQRKTIRDRFDRIYKELGVIEASGNAAFKQHASKPLLSSVMAFGKTISFSTPKPTDDVEEIKAAVSGMKTDDSGVELTFTAVRQAVEKYSSYRSTSHRNIMFVIFSDETGDDQKDVDGAIAACRKFAIPVYVVGVPAPFGRKQAFVKYMPPEQFQQEIMWVPVDQGPESCEPEMVQLGFSGRSGVEETIDSGFGPYALTRLAYETGGIYFAVHPNRDVQRTVNRNDTKLLSSHMGQFFDAEIMRNYRPDYVTQKEYERLLGQNKARLGLVQAAKLSFIQPIDKPPTHFPKVSDGDLANKLSMAQRAAAVLEPKINQLYEMLKQGEKERPKLTQPRWQAGYDLAMGRVLAVKVRTESYNAMLAKAKQGLKFQDPKSDTWQLDPSDEISVSSVLEKQADQAKKLLTRVAQDHKNTPWGVVAERELEEKLGWKWTEKYTGVNKPRGGLGGDGGLGPKPKDDMLKKLEKPRMTAMPKL